MFLIPRFITPPMRLSASRLRPFVAPICTYTKCSPPIWQPAISLATKRWELSKRRGRRSPTYNPATASSYRSTFPAVPATTVGAGCSHSAKPPRSPSTVPVQRCLDIQNSTASSRADKLNTCECPTLIMGQSKSVPSSPTSTTSFFPIFCPTSWQPVKYAHMPDEGVLAVLGLGPVGQFAARIGIQLGYDVVALETVPERREMAARHVVTVAAEHDEAAELVNERTRGRGADGVVDAVGMEAHGNHVAAALQKATAYLPDALGQKALEN